MQKQRWLDALAAIDNIEAQTSVDDVFQVFRLFTRELGGTSLLIGRLANPVLSGKKISNFGMADWPEEYAKKWIEEDLVLHDPITHYAMKTRKTFDWKEAKAFGTKFGKEILDLSEEFNLTNGISIPITVGHLPMGVVSIGYEEAFSPDTISILELVSIHAYSHMLSVMEGEENVSEKTSPAVALTKREIDILTYTAAGKTSWEISKICGIAESTVKTHLKNIMSKTNTSNKTHAVIQAVRAGQVIL